MSTAQSIEENRKHYCTRLTLVRWMLQFCNILQGIDPQTLWNMDETHLAKTIENDLHVISRGDHKQQLEELEANKETVLKSHVSVVCTCNAAGKSFMPMFIRQTQNGDSIPDYIEDVVRGHGLLAQNTSGYMTIKLFYEWSKHFAYYINETFGAPNERESHYILLDSHISRRNKIALQLLKDNNIHVITFPLHCTHVMQPFDVVLANSFKCRVRQLYKDYSKNFAPKDLNKREEFAEQVIYMAAIDAYKQSFNQKFLHIAFSVTGMCPFNLKQLMTRDGITKNDIDFETEMRINFPNRIRITSTLLTDQAFIDKLDFDDFSQCDDKMVVFNYNVSRYFELISSQIQNESEQISMSTQSNANTSSQPPVTVPNSNIHSESQSNGTFHPCYIYSEQTSALNTIIYLCRYCPYLSNCFEKKSLYAFDKFFKEFANLLKVSNRVPINVSTIEFLKYFPSSCKYPSEFLYFILYNAAKNNSIKNNALKSLLTEFTCFDPQDKDVSLQIEAQLILQGSDEFLKMPTIKSKYLIVRWIDEFNLEMINRIKYLSSKKYLPFAIIFRKQEPDIFSIAIVANRRDQNRYLYINDSSNHFTFAKIEDLLNTADQEGFAVFNVIFQKN